MRRFFFMFSTFSLVFVMLFGGMSRVVGQSPTDTPTPESLSGSDSVGVVDPNQQVNMVAAATPTLAKKNLSGATPTLPSESLSASDSVGVVDANQQIDMFGGGGGAPCNDLNNNAIAYNDPIPGGYCVFTTYPINTSVTVTLSRPDGSLYLTQTSPVVADGLTGQLEVEVALPLFIGLPFGTWTYSATHNGQTETGSYQLTLNTKPSLHFQCNSGQPAVVVAGFSPSQSVDLLLMAVNGQADFGNQYTGKTAFHWRVSVGDQGYLVVQPTVRLDPNKSYFIKLANASSNAVTPFGIGEIIPFGSCTCKGFSLSSRVLLGTNVVITPGSANLLNSDALRPSLHPQSKTLGRIPPGGTALVIDGPKCADNILWWQVDFNGIVGWTGEGQGSDYWIAPVQ